MAKVQKSPATKENYLPEVRNQYENFPYPPRKAEDEKNSFIFCYLSAIDAINHYCFEGKRDYRKGFRVLVAGGGTGDATIAIAEQLKDFPAEVVHLDISKASIEVAKARGEARNLDNIKWLHGSLLDAPQILEGKFDFINCVGVLHHLESPEAGLAALSAVLKDDGVMGLMVYAKYGREGVYQIQNLMKVMNKNEDSMQQRVENCKAILSNIPLTNSFVSLAGTLHEISLYGDVGIYDLFLHSQDVAYTVPELYKLLASSDIKLVKFCYESDARGNNRYKLETYINNDHLAKVVRELPIEEQHAAAELLHGGMIKHAFYAAKIKKTEADVNSLDNIPFFSMLIDSSGYQNIYDVVRNYQVGQEVACKTRHIEIKFIKTPQAENIFKYMDGNRTIKEMFKSITSSYPSNAKKPSGKELFAEFLAIYNAFNLWDMMLLRHQSVPKYKTTQEIHENFGKKAPVQPALSLI